MHSILSLPLRSKALKHLMFLNGSFPQFQYSGQFMKANYICHYSTNIQSFSPQAIRISLSSSLSASPSSSYSSSSSSRPLYYKSQIRYLFNSKRKTAMNPYEVLEVTRNATDKEIKSAYFKQAKKHHPDLNPGDKKASEKFQRVAFAYEILSDPQRRADYDLTGRTSEQQAQYTYKGDEKSRQQHAEDIFRSVQEDAEIVKEAFASFVQDIQDEFAYAAECASRGDWKEVWEVVKVNKGLVFGVIVPMALIFRFPGLVILAGRLIFAASQILLIGLLRQGNLPQVAHWVWKRIVTLALERNRRKRNK